MFLHQVRSYHLILPLLSNPPSPPGIRRRFRPLPPAVSPGATGCEAAASAAMASSLGLWGLSVLELEGPWVCLCIELMFIHLIIYVLIWF